MDTLEEMDVSREVEKCCYFSSVGASEVGYCKNIEVISV